MSESCLQVQKLSGFEAVAVLKRVVPKAFLEPRAMRQSTVGPAAHEGSNLIEGESESEKG